ncbi:MAG: pilus assembly protein TadG-related protein [Nitrosomonas sp.]|uniref:pilus assembly protein TadG-related protein n=1 Tax=Nitrosomonas sp. TaxID=42353 RepID=UPI00272FD1AB|nr:pilus assembly protein TadG-related protein [Nitrosomonas sp.]MDP1549294.1 pilus assembly protein TadG-related protein [Nitrosomonas sp.]
MRITSESESERRWTGNLSIGKEQGVVAIMVALLMVVLVGFVGLALDLGKLFVTKTELQNSADACALAAARELTGANNNQLTLAEAAGIAVGTSNSVQFQNNVVTINSDGVTFSDAINGTYQTKDAVARVLTMKFVRCTVERTGIANWFVQVSGNQRVAATAVATLSSGQTTCGLPITVCESAIATKTRGDWISASLDPGDGLTGNFMWANFEGHGVKTIKEYLTSNGQCNLPATGAQVDNAGIKGGAYSAWNTRFGVYQGTYNGYQDGIPDLTGVSYTGKSWPQCNSAFSDFVVNRATYTPYPGLKDDDLKVVPPANAISSNDHQAHGADRRLIIVPVVDCSAYTTAQKASVKKWACLLMLHPLDQNADDNAQCKTLSAIDNSRKSLLSHFLAMMNPINSAFAATSGSSGDSKKDDDKKDDDKKDDGKKGDDKKGDDKKDGNGKKFAYLEYLGLASDPDSPCASVGVVGGLDSSGSLVPALVQ